MKKIGNILWFCILISIGGGFSAWILFGIMILIIIVYAIIYVLINDKKVEDDDEDITNKE